MTSATDPATGLSFPLYNPREQRWEEHFSWSEDYLRITGLTLIDRATVKALQLNREGLVNVRRVLYALSEHPRSSSRPEAASIFVSVRPTAILWANDMRALRARGGPSISAGLPLRQIIQ